jgi:choline dehydrogenase
MEGGNVMADPSDAGERVNRLMALAYGGGISRRSFTAGLIACGFTAGAANDAATHAAWAEANQAALRAKLRDEYDYIVVGAGSAGCVLANRLSAAGANVLLIEGGGTDIQQPKIALTERWSSNFGTDTDWGHKSVPQKHLKDRVIVAPVGKIIGGGSSINATAWLRGSKQDYDAWESAAGPNWSFEKLVPAFKRVERYEGGENELRGGDGAIATRMPAANHPATLALIAAAKEMGFKEHFDINNTADWLEAAGQQSTNTDHGMRRFSAVHGYLYPALTRANLTLLPDTLVTKIDVENGVCRGVTTVLEGETRSFRAAKEVILSAGGIMSPRLLMLSGIGPAAHLRDLGIPVVVDAKNVGQNLHDHLLLRVFWSSNGKMPPRQDTDHAGVAYLRTNSALPGPNIQISGRQQAPGVAGLKADEGFAISPGLTKPLSRGTVRLASSDPNALAIVDPNYFAEQADVDAYVAGIEFSLALGNSKAFAEFRKDQISLKGADKAAIADYVRDNALTYFHFVGTCAMGRDQSAVVDESLRVRGVDRLRVADGSAIPQVTVSNTNPAVLTLAERAAEIILSPSDHAETRSSAKPL